jgi:hypothetical protein
MCQTPDPPFPCSTYASLLGTRQAHNIDNVCIEALSVDLDERALEKATRCLGRISSEVSLGAVRVTTPHVPHLLVR